MTVQAVQATLKVLVEVSRGGRMHQAVVSINIRYVLIWESIWQQALDDA